MSSAPIAWGMGRPTQGICEQIHEFLELAFPKLSLRGRNLVLGDIVMFHQTSNALKLYGFRSCDSGTHPRRDGKLTKADSKAQRLTDLLIQGVRMGLLDRSGLSSASDLRLAKRFHSVAVSLQDRTWHIVMNHDSWDSLPSSGRKNDPKKEGPRNSNLTSIQTNQTQSLKCALTYAR